MFAMSFHQPASQLKTTQEGKKSAVPWATNNDSSVDHYSKQQVWRDKQPKWVWLVYAGMARHGFFVPINWHIISKHWQLCQWEWLEREIEYVRDRDWNHEWNFTNNASISFNIYIPRYTYIYIHLARITYPNKLLMHLHIDMIVWLWQKKWHVYQAVSTHRTSAEAASKPTVSSAVTCREPTKFMRKAFVNAGHCCKNEWIFYGLSMTG